MPSSNNRTIRVISHNNGESARALAERFGTRLLRKGRTDVPDFVRNSYVINLGVSDTADRVACLSGNYPQAVGSASDKVMFALCIMEEGGINVPPFTTDGQQGAEGLFDVAPAYNNGNTRSIVARTLTRASGGRGIQIVHQGDPIPHAPLYTAYIPKHEEYRVHVGHDQVSDEFRVIDLTKKSVRLDRDIEEPVDYQIRNYENGWIFTRDNIDYSASYLNNVIDQAIDAVRALDLQFGAVDVIVQANRERTVYVLEVNTAPGMEGTTLDRYVEYFTCQANEREFVSPVVLGQPVPSVTTSTMPPPATVPRAPTPPTPTFNPASASTLATGALVTEVVSWLVANNNTPADQIADQLSVFAERFYDIRS